MDIALECVLKTKEHAKIVASWRSDEHARKMSLHQKLMSEEEFYSHFARSYFQLKELPPLFARVDGKRQAFVGFDFVQDAPEKIARISIVVAPDARGRGVGSRFLHEVICFSRQQGYDKLLAEIRHENTASIRAFEKAGFLFEKDFSKEVEGKKAALKLYSFRLREEQAKAPVFVIGEAGSNWKVGDPALDFEMACKMIQAAKQAGCDAVKFQVFRPNTLYVPNAGSADYMEKMGIGQSMEEVFTHLSMPYEMIPKLVKVCGDEGIEFMATPFSKLDFEAIDPYVKRHKIGSYELGHLRLLECAARSQKPLYLSTGVSTVDDISWAVSYFKERGGKDLTLLQCCAQYPASDSGMHLSAIPWMRSYFGLPVGLSDHSPDPTTAPIAAVALGATCVEKHFTISKKLAGPDHSFAVEPLELKALVDSIRRCEVMLGQSVKHVAKEEAELYAFARRGVQAIRPIKAGDVFEEDKNVAILRPGKQKIGMHPRFMDELVGKKAVRDIKLGEGVQEHDWH